MQQFFSLLSWRLFTAQHVSGVLPPTIRSSTTAVAASGFTFVSWWLAVLCLWSARPRTQHGYHNDMKVKPEAATAVVEFLMVGGRTPETCWAVNKRQDNKLENCCIWLVIYLNCTMMHGLTNLKFTYGGGEKTLDQTSHCCCTSNSLLAYLFENSTGQRPCTARYLFLRDAISHICCIV